MKQSANEGDFKQELFFFKVLYVVIYWTIFVLSWIVIPLAQEYEKAGDFTSGKRFKRAIRRNIIFYVIFIVLGVIFLTYLIVKKQLSGKHLIGFLMALSNAWGIFLIIFLLGYGLVAVPKHILKLSDYETRIKELEWQAGECYDSLMGSNEDLVACANVFTKLIECRK